jgi:pimeloyl-ACP methyl ester carboxylesterase
VRRLIVAVSLAACLAGCGGAPHPAVTLAPTPTSAAPTLPSAFDGCLDPAQARELPAIPETVGTVRPVALGRGARAVVLSEQSDQDLCGWLQLVPRLVAAGYEVVLWDYGTGAPADELRQVVATVRAAGPTQIALVGASKGAKTSLVVAAASGAPVRGVVSLSAESILQPSIDVAGYVANLTCPVLFVTATADAYGAMDAGREFARVARSKDKRLLTVDGQDHGTALLSGAHASAVTEAVLDFLRRVLG